jgi:hypothetical protein
MKTNRKPIFKIVLINLAIIAVVAELVVRTYGVLVYKVPFFKQQHIIGYYYPELNPFLSGEVKNADAEELRVLILGGSAATNTLCDIEANIESSITVEGKKVNAYSLARYAQNSLDARLKYEFVKDYHFDYIFYYEAINDNRANNCPKEVFKENYSHIEFYNDVQLITKHKELKFVALPFYIDFLINKIAVSSGKKKLIPKEYFVLNKKLFDPQLLRQKDSVGTPGWNLYNEMKNRPDKVVTISMQDIDTNWINDGSDIKSAKPYYNNVKAIEKLSKAKGEKLILASYAYYLPADYSLIKFLYEKMDYAEQRWPVEIYGKSANVLKGLAVHDSIINSIANNNPNILYFNFDSILPHTGEYFNDVCHLSPQGCLLLSQQLADKIKADNK